MREAKGNLFELAISNKDVDAVCINTNQHYSLDGRAVMQDRLSLECNQRWPATSFRLAKCLKNFGTNVPFIIGAFDGYGQHLEPNIKMIKAHEFKALIFSFPTVNNLNDGSNLELIKNSAIEMINMANRYNLQGIALARSEGLLWSDIREALASILDNRFIIITDELD
jgi:hypothetical protein